MRVGVASAAVPRCRVAGHGRGRSFRRLRGRIDAKITQTFEHFSRAKPIAFRWSALAFLLALTASGTALADDAEATLSLGDEETVRIAVGRFRDHVDIAGVDVALLCAGCDGMPKKGSARIALKGRGLVVNGRKVPANIVVAEAPVLTLSGHRYRNLLEVRVQIYKGTPELLVVHPLGLETYVTGIVSSELPRGWPLGAYQAQAVAARTFAVMQKYRRLDLPYHMESSVLDQVYGGMEREHALAEEAAASTRGMILSSERHLAQTYFHAACGGRTESAKEGWGTAIDYMPGSKCGFCTDAGRASWTVKRSAVDVDKAFKKLVGGAVDEIRIVSKTATGRAKRVELKSGSRKKTITGADFRRLLGWSVVWSTQIDALRYSRRDGLVVEGRGSGHGVGMCQWGARGMALKDIAWREILGRYYPGARLVQLY